MLTGRDAAATTQDPGRRGSCRSAAKRPTDERGAYLLDGLIDELRRLRATHGNLPVIVVEFEQDKLLGVGRVTAFNAGHAEVTAAEPGAYVVLDSEEGLAPPALRR